MALAAPYDGLADGWDSGAGHVYRPLARALVAVSPVALGGGLVVDVGSGTGAVADALSDIGALVVAADSSASMLAFQYAERRPAVVGDALALPFGDGAFDGATAGFVLNHLDPVPVLREMARVVRTGGVVLASTWATARPDVVKGSIDSVLSSWGWVRPAWYRALKADTEPLSGSSRTLAAAAEEAGLVSVRARERREDLGLRSPGAVVAYRFSLPHIAPWVAALDGPTRAEVTRRALAAAAPHVEAWRPAVVVLAGRAAHPERRAADRSRASA